MGLHHHHWVNLYNRRAVVAGQLGQLPGETVLYRIDVVSLAKQSSQYGFKLLELSPCWTQREHQLFIIYIYT